MTAKTLTASREANEAKMAAIITARPTTQLVVMYELARGTFDACRREDKAAVALTIDRMEKELRSRGIQICNDCGHLNGKHDASYHFDDEHAAA
jgi:hypothetical protein